MKIVGCDLHARQQSIAMLDTDTGELVERKLEHEGGQLRDFYAALEGPVVVGIEATGAMQWFLELMEELGIECQVGHPAKIRAADTRHQKHDRRDAQLLLQLMVEKRFPQLWIPNNEQRDLRTLLRDRHQWVRLRTQVQSVVQAIALNHGLRKGRTLWSATGREALMRLALPPHMAQRRNALLCLHDSLNQRIQDLHRQVEAEAQQRPRARQLMTHPGVGAGNGTGNGGVSRRPATVPKRESSSQLYRNDSVRELQRETPALGRTQQRGQQPGALLVV